MRTILWSQAWEVNLSEDMYSPSQLSANEIGSDKNIHRLHLSENVHLWGGIKSHWIICHEAGEFKVNGERKKAVGIGDVFRDFFNWLKKFTSIVLIAHNGRRFDFPVLVGAAWYCHLLDVLYSVVHACIDSFFLFRKIFPGQPDYKRDFLVKSLQTT